MALEIESLSELDAEEVQQVRLQQEQLIAEAFPQFHIRRGVIAGVTLRIQAALETAQRAYINRVLRSRSLLDIQNDPALADNAIVDQVMSNYQVTRREGSQATGQATIVLSTLSPVTIPSGSSFTGNSAQFVTVVPFAARLTAGAITGPNDRLLVPLGDGTFAFTIDLVAVEEGPQGLLRLGTRIDPAQPPRGFLRAYATRDFTGGLLEESNEDLLARLQEGAATKAYSNRVTTAAMIHNEPDFSDVLAISMIGHGDPQQLRHKHSIFPVAHGGRVDVYVRTSGIPLRLRVRKTCTLVERTAAGSIFQFALGRDEVPGCYDVESVVPPDTSETLSGYEVVEAIRSADMTGDIYLPDVANAIEAAFTRYQAMVVKFLDTSSAVLSLEVGDTRDYDAMVRYMPKIAELQTFLGARDRNPPMADILVRAAIPCFTSIHFDIRKRATLTINSSLVDQIKLAVAAKVNATGFLGQLHASSIADVVHDLLPEGAWTSGFDLFGRILRPDGTFTYIRDPAVLSVPDNPNLMLSGRTVSFLLDSADVGIAVVNAGVVE